METRKVQVTGGSTYTVSLPKDWANENDVAVGSSISFFSHEYGLVLTPRRGRKGIEGRLDIATRSDDELMRAIIAMYVNGFNTITIETHHITPGKRRAIRTTTQNLVGLEIVEETDKKIVVQDLLNASQMSIHDAISQMKVIAMAMLEDAVSALAETDEDAARNVIERDDDMDRLWFVVSRTFRRTLRTPAVAEELGFPRETCFDFYTCGRQLERIADHAAKIGQVAIELDAIPERVVEAVSELHAEAAAIVTTAMEAFLTDDRKRATRLANEARESIFGITESGRSIDDLLRDLEPYQAHQLRLSIDSLSRCADYGGNIAETALQNAAPRP